METGGCSCGSIRYKFERENVEGIVPCVCTDCQALRVGETFTMIETDKLEIQGDIKIWSNVDPSGLCIHRGFCSECGCCTYTCYIPPRPDIGYIPPRPNIMFIGEHSNRDDCIAPSLFHF